MHGNPLPAISAARPAVWLGGEFGHPDFAEAVALLRNSADVLADPSPRPPEVVVLAQSRPGTIGRSAVEALRRRFPLAGFVLLAGTWCEGEPRTGRPPAGMHRLYWYEFGPWWHEQLARWAAGSCPAWAWPAGGEGLSADRPPDPCAHLGLIVLETTGWDTADTLADVLHPAGYATAWSPPCKMPARLHGAVAGIWEGCQLDEAEVPRLAQFCRRVHSAPVVALLDFPRRERCERAIEIGAAAVVAKPWRNCDLLSTLARVVAYRRASVPHAA